MPVNNKNLPKITYKMVQDEMDRHPYEELVASPGWDKFVHAVGMAEEIRDCLVDCRRNYLVDGEGALTEGFVKFLASTLRELNFRILDANYILCKFVLDMNIQKSQIFDEKDKESGITKYIYFPEDL